MLVLEAVSKIKFQSVSLPYSTTVLSTICLNVVGILICNILKWENILTLINHYGSSFKRHCSKYDLHLATQSLSPSKHIAFITFICKFLYLNENLAFLFI